MKPYTKVILLACYIAVISSCSKDDAIPPDNYISYKIDGASKKAQAEAIYSVDDNSLLIDGSDELDDISLYINSAMPGTYYLGGINDNIGATYGNLITSTFYNSISGTLVIDSYTGSSISGSFQFTATDSNGIVTKNITEGRFNTQIEEDYGSSNTTGYLDNNRGVDRNTKLMSRYLHLRQIKKIGLKLPVQK